MIRAALGLVWRDRALRLIAVAILSFACFVASLAPYQSVLAVRVFGFSDTVFAVIFAVGAGVSLVCAVGVGLVNDRTGRRRNAARLAACAGCLGAGLVALSEARWAYLVAHLVAFPVSATLFAQLFTLARLAGGAHPPEMQVAIQTVIRALFAVPFVVVLPLWALAFQNGVPLLAIYWVCAASMGVTFGIFVLFWPRDGATAWRDGGSGLSLSVAMSELAAPRVVVRVCLLIGVVCGATLYLMLTGLILLEQSGRDAGDVARFAALVAGLEIPFMLALSPVVARLGAVRVIGGAAILYAGFLAVFPLAGPFDWVWFLALPAAIGAAAILTVPLLYLQDLLAERPGAGGALIAIVSLSGQVVASAIFALGTAIGGYGMAAWLGAALVGICGVGLVRVDRVRGS